MKGVPRFRRATRALAVALTLLGTSAVPTAAQTMGDGYLFSAPRLRLNVRLGFSQASASSDIFGYVTDRLTLDKGDFGGSFAGGELGLRLGERFEMAVDVSSLYTSKGSEYRFFVDNNDRPIAQTTSLKRVPVLLNARYYLTPAGRTIGSFAWIPATVSPWVGAGAGMMWYRFEQSGDFMDEDTFAVFFDRYESQERRRPAAQLMGGADISLNPRFALSADARYLFARAPLGTDFVGFNPIDLSGVTVALGLTLRL